jgi:Tol biopolymer transport system component
MISRDPDLDLQASTFGGHASSADGRFVIFSANDDDLPGADGTRDVYVRDRRRDRTQLVSKDSDGQPIDTSAGDNPAISDNGRFVAFISNASNLPGSTGDGQAYVHDRRTGNTRLVSKTSSGVAADDDADDPSLSASGRFVAFASDAANLPGQDVVQSVYVHDRRTGKTRLASKTSGGTPADGHSERPSLSADGSRVAFSSQADNLPGPDTWSDVYVWDFDTRRLRHVSQTSGGEELTTPSHSTAGALSANGRFVAFESTDPALPGGTNSYYLIYVHDLASR